MKNSISVGYPNCVSQTELGRCRQLALERCAGEKCPFMKTKEACQTQELKVYERLASLDEETQQRISVKYYHGTRPWQILKKDEGPRRKRRKRSDAAK